MLPNIDKSFYVRFKKEGYKKFKEAPVPSINDIVHLGYLDVCRTIGGIKSKQRSLFKQKVVMFINDLLSMPPENQNDFDILHHQCCQQCLEADSLGSASIHYGQAQKLLNMSLKYLYNEFAAYYEDLNRFRFPDNNIEHLFYLPIDGQIRDHLVKYCNFLVTFKSDGIVNYGTNSDPFSISTYQTKEPEDCMRKRGKLNYVNCHNQMQSLVNRFFTPKGKCKGFRLRPITWKMLWEA